MMQRTVSALAVLALAITMSARVDAKPTAERSAASHELYLRGLDAFNHGDFALASRLWQSGYDLDPRPLFLFNIGQAARKMGDKPRAVEFFLKFVAADPNAPERPEVDRLIQELSPSVPEETDPASSPPPPLATPAPAPPPAAPSPVVVAGAGVAKPVAAKRRDRLALGLLGAGAGTLAIGIPVAAWAGSKVSHSTDSYTAFSAARNAQAPLAVGCVFAGVGAGLVAAGLGRYAVVERRRKLSLAVAPSPSGAVAQVGGVF